MDNNPDKVIDNENKDSKNLETQVNDTEKIIGGIKAEMLAERKKRQELESKLKAIDDAKLAEDGKYKELLQAKEKELDSLKPKLALADEYEALQKAEREEAKKQLGDNWDDSYNQLPIAALRKLLKTFAVPGKVADTDGGKGKGSHETKTELEKKLEVARQNGSPLHIILALERQIQEQQK